MRLLDGTRVAPKGNPTDTHALPDSRPQTTFTTERTTANPRRTAARYVQAAIICSITCFGGWIVSIGQGPFDGSTFVILLVCLIMGTAHAPNPLSGILVISVLLTALLLTVPPSSTPLHVAAAFMFVFALLFRRHYWAIAHLADFGQLGIRPKSSPSRSPLTILCGFSDAVTSWLTYGSGGTALPGMFRSPAGSHRFRLWCTVLLLVALAVGLHSYCASVIPPPRSDSVPVRFYHPLLPFAACFILPVPIVYATCFIATFGVLHRCYVRRLAAREPEALATHFYPLIESMKCSADPIERRSIPIGHCAEDRMPLFWQFTSGQHAHVTGRTGSGKSAMTMRLMESMFYSGAFDYAQQQSRNAERNNGTPVNNNRKGTS